MTRKKISLSPDDYRALQYFRQAKICTFHVPVNPVVPCLRYMQAGKDEVDLVLNGAARAFYRNLQTCNRVWLCPICANKISQKRRKKLQKIVDLARKNGARLAFITYTIQHTIDDPFLVVKNRVLDAHRELHSHRQWKLIQNKFAWLGSIRAFEVTDTPNGWHIHLHEIGFIDGAYDQQALETTLSERWDHMVASVGGYQKPGVGLDLKKSDAEVRRYITKWGIVPELSQSASKVARDGGMIPFQFPDAIFLDSRRESKLRDRFCEYAEGVHGTKQLAAGKSIKAMLGDDIAELETADRVFPAIATLTPDQWRLISTAGLRVRCLKAIENGELKEFLADPIFDGV